MKKENKKQTEQEEIILEEEQEEQSGFSKNSGSKLKKEIKKLKEERKEYLNGWQRARAEMANLKKQHAEEKKLFTALGKEAFLLEIIPILDNFEAAFSNKEVWEKVDTNWRTGIEYIYNQFTQILENNGVEQTGKVGEKFDEKIHSAIENIPTENQEKNQTIAEVTQKGYQIGEKVIREAKVKVFELKN